MCHEFLTHPLLVFSLFRLCFQPFSTLLSALFGFAFSLFRLCFQPFSALLSAFFGFAFSLFRLCLSAFFGFVFQPLSAALI